MKKVAGFVSLALTLCVGCVGEPIMIDLESEFAGVDARAQLGQQVFGGSAMVAPLGQNLAGEDQDHDGAVDLQDNCPRTFNTDQADRDGDGLGDVCDPAPDSPAYVFKAFTAVPTDSTWNAAEQAPGPAPTLEVGVERACSQARREGVDGTFLTTAKHPIAVILDAEGTILGSTPFGFQDFTLAAKGVTLKLPCELSKASGTVKALYFQACDDANGNGRCDYDGDPPELNLTHRSAGGNGRGNVQGAIAPQAYSTWSTRQAVLLPEPQDEGNQPPFSYNLGSIDSPAQVRVFVKNERYDNGKNHRYNTAWQQAALAQSRQRSMRVQSNPLAVPSLHAFLSNQIVVDRRTLGEILRDPELVGRTGEVQQADTTTTTAENAPVTEDPPAATGAELGGTIEDCDAGYSPLVLDLGGQGIELSSPLVAFNLAPTGTDDVIERSGWVVSKDTPFLVLDLDNNGLIDNGGELFGNFTLVAANGVRAANGFEALAQYDSNRNLFLDQEDEVYQRLRLWEDINLDGRSQSDELTPLADRGVVAIDLLYDDNFFEEDAFFNKTLQRSTLLLESPAAGAPRTSRTIFDVWFNYENTALRP